MLCNTKLVGIIHRLMHFASCDMIKIYWLSLCLVAESKEF